MPGTEDRQPSDADRAPASRVGDQLQEVADEAGVGEGATDEEAAAVEAEAVRRAEDAGWDQAQTAREGGTAAEEEHTPTDEQAATNREEDPPA